MKTFPINFRAISVDSKLFSFFPKKTKKLTPLGAGGAPHFFYPKSYFVFDLKPHAKFQNHAKFQKSNGGRKKKEREKNAVNSGHLVP